MKKSDMDIKTVALMVLGLAALLVLFLLYSYISSSGLGLISHINSSIK